MSWPWWTAEDQRLRREVYERGRAELFRHNRWLAAKRHDWPMGVLEACVRLDRPGWTVTWRPDRREFWAVRDDYHRVEISGAGADAVSKAMDDAPSPHVWFAEPGCWCRGSNCPQLIRIQV